MRFLSKAVLKQQKELDEVLKAAKDHPLVKKIREDTEAETLKEREELSEKLSALKGEEGEVISIFIKDFEKTQKRYDIAKKKLEAVSKEVSKAKIGLNEKRAEFGHSIRKTAEHLRVSASPELDEAIEVFKTKIDWLRKPGRFVREAGVVERNIFTWSKSQSVSDNNQAILRALSYCKHAIQTIENMKMFPTFDPEDIKKLKDEIPSINTFKQYTKKRNMEKGALPAQKILDDHDNKTMGALDAKYELLMMKNNKRNFNGKQTKASSNSSRRPRPTGYEKREGKRRL